MKNVVSKILIFAIGAAAGSFATWKLLQKKYEDTMREETESLKEMYTRHYKNNDQTKTDGSDKKVTQQKPSLDEIKKYLDHAKEYINNETEEKKEPKEVLTVVTTKDPYIIEPGEFGEEDDYEAISLTYYADGVLTDDWDNVIENPDAMIGPDALNHFGEYEDDSVFVRNEDLKSDFEILLDVRNYSDIPESQKHHYTLDDE